MWNIRFLPQVCFSLQQREIFREYFQQFYWGRKEEKIPHHKFLNAVSEVKTFLKLTGLSKLFPNKKFLETCQKWRK